jgi:hypothetical protein
MEALMNSFKFSKAMAIAAATLAPAMLYVVPASADSSSSYSRSRLPRHSVDLDTVTESTPNEELIASGLFTFGIPYIASVVAATESTRRGDEKLYIPVAGPWLNLAQREDCPAGGTCGNETAYRVLLVADGVLQGLGALEFLGGFLFPVSRTETAQSPRVRVMPTVARTGYGLSAFGTF